VISEPWVLSRAMLRNISGMTAYRGPRCGGIQAKRAVTIVWMAGDGSFGPPPFFFPGGFYPKATAIPGPARMGSRPILHMCKWLHNEPLLNVGQIVAVQASANHLRDCWDYQALGPCASEESISPLFGPSVFLLTGDVPWRAVAEGHPRP